MDKRAAPLQMLLRLLGRGGAAAAGGARSAMRGVGSRMKNLPMPRRAVPTSPGTGWHVAPGTPRPPMPRRGMFSAPTQAAQPSAPSFVNGMNQQVRWHVSAPQTAATQTAARTTGQAMRMPPAPRRAVPTTPGTGWHVAPGTPRPPMPRRGMFSTPTSSRAATTASGSLAGETSQLASQLGGSVNLSNPQHLRMLQAIYDAHRRLATGSW